MKNKKAFADFLYLAAVLNPFRKTILAHEYLLGMNFYAYKRDVIGRSIFKTGSHEPIISNWLVKKYRDKEGFYIDIGANLGYFTCLLSKILSKKACVYAFEPEPENVKLLERNIHLNSLENIKTFPIALGENNSTASLNVYKSSNRGRHSLQGQPTGRAIEVPVKPLDEVLSTECIDNNLPSIDFMKIDVEGYEPNVLRGATETIKKTKCLMLEYSPYLMNNKLEDKEDFLRNLAENFSIVLEVTKAGLKETTAEAIIQRTDQFDLIFEK